METSATYDYLYSTGDLRDFAATAEKVASRAKTVFVMFNNCRVDHAMKSALGIQGILGILG